MAKNIQNPGSALGEAIGAEMEKALNSFLTDIAESAGHHFVSKGFDSDGRQTKKLLMFDTFGTSYNIDSVIANQAMQPIVLVESKYIRYKKHNRDKGSWVCTAHTALRKRYPSIRSSIAVLAGSWSLTSIAMMKSHDINIFLIPFERICDLLSAHGIMFDWGEKDRAGAIAAWSKFTHLSVAERANIGDAMIEPIKDTLKTSVLTILDETRERQVDRVSIELHSNTGEVKIYEFTTVAEAVEFLNSETLRGVFITTDSPSLFDSFPPA